MVLVDLSISQLLTIGGIIGFGLAYLMFLWIDSFFRRNKECDKCRGRGYIRR